MMQLAMYPLAWATALGAMWCCPFVWLYCHEKDSAARSGEGSRAADNQTDLWEEVS